MSSLRGMKNIAKYLDFAFCLIVIPLMALIFPVERWIHHFPWYVLTVGIWLYTLYFVNRFFTVPSFFGNKRRRFAAFLFILLSIWGTYALSSIHLYTPKPIPRPFDEGIIHIFKDIYNYQQAVWSLFMIVESFSFMIALMVHADRQRAKNQEIEAERDKAQIALYKARIKPHFMFNTLNSLYGLFITHNENALPSLEKFISMLRYIQINADRDLVKLSEEIDYIRQYVEIQTLRLNEKTEVKLEIKVSDYHLRIPPMLLVTFVENCFKHGVSPVEKSVIHISLCESGGEMIFTTTNKKFPIKHPGEHLGIANCSRRLALLYPGCHTLLIHDDGDTFNVTLKIKLHP